MVLARLMLSLWSMLTNKDVLKDKVQAKQKALEARLAELKADTHEAATQERQKIDQHLSELQTSIKDGWDNLSERASAKLNTWLDEN